MFVSDTRDFVRRFKPVKGKPLTFTAPGLIRGQRAETLELAPFFRLHDSRYMLYWPYSTPANFLATQAAATDAEAGRLALDAQTIDQVAPGEQQPESDHAFAAKGGESGISAHGRWRHAKEWFSYTLNDPKREAKVLRLTFARGDAGRKFDVEVNGTVVAGVELDGKASTELYTRDIPVSPSASGKLVVRFVAQPGSIAGGLYGLRLLR
jgi:hypothetical protein